MKIHEEILDDRNKQVKKIILFGAGNGGKRILHLLRRGHEVVAFADNDSQKQNMEICGIPVIAPEKIKEIDYDNIIITSVWGESIIPQLVSEYGIEKDKIIDYYHQNYYDVRIATMRMVAEEIYERKIEGNVAELGVFKGDFARNINMEFPDRKLYLFDTFEGFNPEDVVIEAEKNFSQASVGEYCNENIELVLNKMNSKENCVIKKGYFPETAVGLEDKFVFVSLDVDLYKPTYDGLCYFYPRLVNGGSIFIHDYNNFVFNGVKEAVRKYCDEMNIGFTPMSDLGGSVIISK